MTKLTYTKIKEYHEKIFDFEKKLNLHLECEEIKKTKTHTQNFEALDLEAEINNDTFFYDFGALEHPRTFSKIFNSAFYGTALSEKEPEEEKRYGGECRTDLLSNTLKTIKTASIFYKLPENNDVLSAYIKGHEEAHAIIQCEPAIYVFEKYINQRFKLNTNNLKKEKEYHEFMANIGGIIATQNKNYSIEETVNSLKHMYADIKTCETILRVLEKIGQKA